MQPGWKPLQMAGSEPLPSHHPLHPHSLLLDDLGMIHRSILARLACNTDTDAMHQRAWDAAWMELLDVTEKICALPQGTPTFARLRIEAAVGLLSESDDLALRLLRKVCLDLDALTFPFVAR